MKYLNYTIMNISFTKKTIKKSIVLAKCISILYLLILSNLLYGEELENIAGLSAAWVNIGPENIAGKIRACTISTTDTDVMWVGSDGSGIWKSLDGGISWSRIDTFPANLSVSDIIINPLDANIMYAGTGNGFDLTANNRGEGIFKSTDGGVSWDQLSSTSSSDWYFVNSLSINTDGTILLAASNSGIFRSENGGDTWTRILDAKVYDLQFDPNSTSKAVAAESAGLIWYTTDGGESWTAGQGIPETSGRIELDYSPSVSGVVWASVNIDNGAVYTSVDGGVNYELWGTPEHLEDYGEESNAIWCVKNNSGIVYVAGKDLYKLDVLSKSWTVVSNGVAAPVSAHFGHNAIVPHPEFGNGGANNDILFDCTNGGIFKADVTAINGDFAGSGWTALNNKLITTQIVGIARNLDGSVVIAGTHSNGTISYSGEKSDWIKIMLRGGGVVFDHSDSTFCYGLSRYLNIFRNSNSGLIPATPCDDYINGMYYDGSTWQWKDAPYYIPDAKNQNCEEFAPFVLDENLPEQTRMLAGGLELWKTDDLRTENTINDGPSWVSIKPATGVNISSIRIALGNSDMICVGYVNGDVYKTENGTEAIINWEKLDDNTSTLPNRKVQDIWIDPNNTARVFVCFDGFEADNVYLTEDGGDSWQLANGSGVNLLPEVPVMAITAHPNNSNWMYAGTPKGLFVSEDAGHSWMPSTGGLASAYITSLVWSKDASDVDVLNSGTNGYGVFYTPVPYNPPAPEIDIEGITVNEGNDGDTTTAILKVTLSKATEFPISVDFTTDDGTALVSDNDYEAKSGTLVFNDNEVQTISISVFGDDTVEENETFTVSLSSSTEEVIFLHDSASVIIADDDNPELPSVSISTSDMQIVEDGGLGTVSFALSEASSEDVVINLDFSGSADINKDYTVSTQIITIPAGDLSADLTITSVQDDIDEYDENIVVTISSVLNAKVETVKSVDISILDDDDAPDITINDISVNASDTEGVFVVTLSKATEKTISVDYATADITATAGEDYVPVSDKLTFAPEETEKNITISILKDDTNDSDQTFALNLSNSTEDAVISDNEGICTIIAEVKPPEITINDVIVSEVDAGDYNYARFEITLINAKDFPVNVDYATEDDTAVGGSDYRASSGTLSFVSNGTAFLNIMIYGDDAIEDNETFFLNITGVPEGVNIVKAQGQCIIADNDDPNLPEVTVNVNPLEIEEGNGASEITATLSAVYTKDVIVNLKVEGDAVGNGVDYTLTDKTIIVPQGQLQSSVTLTALSDNLDEVNETVSISVDAVLNGLLTDSQTYDVTILDADAPPEISIDNISVEEGDTGVQTADFTVSLSKPSGKTITLDYSTADGSATVMDNDYFAKSAILTFEPGEVSKDIQILIISDEKFEDDEEFYIDLSNASDGTPIVIPQGTCTILNDDSSKPPSISISDVTVDEGNSPDTVNAIFTVTLSDTKHFPVTVSYMSIDNTANSEAGDYDAVEGVLTFDDNDSQEITVVVNGDDLYETNETFFMNLYNISPGVEFAKHLGICTITDDDVEPPAISIEDIHVPESNQGETADAVFTITLTSAYTVPITVDYETADGTAFSPEDYTAASGTITFEPGETEANVSIIINGDFEDESDEVFILKLLNPVNATIDDSMGVCFIEDDDESYKLWVNKGEGTGEYSAGETVAISADPAENGYEFKEWIGNSEFLVDKNASNTTLVMPEREISLTATYESAEKVSLGSVIELAATDIPDMNMATFTKRPKIYGTYYDVVKDKDIKLSTQVLTKVNASMPVEKVKAIWKKTVALYDKKLLKDAKKSGILTAKWLEMNPWQNKSDDCNLYAKVAIPSGDKVDLYVQSVLLSVPQITSVEIAGGDVADGVTAGNQLTLKGKYFGGKAPRVYFEYILNGVVKQQKVKVLKPLKYSDGKGSPGKSCMDVESPTGESELHVQLPTTWWKTWSKGEYYIVIDNKIGLGTYLILTK